MPIVYCDYTNCIHKSPIYNFTCSKGVIEFRLGVCRYYSERKGGEPKCQEKKQNQKSQTS